MIFWISLSVVVTTMVLFIADVSEEMNELFLGILAIIALIIVLVFMATRRVG